MVTRVGVILNIAKNSEKKVKIYLDTIVAGGDTSILHFYVGRRMSEFTFGVGPGAFVPLKFTAHFELQPA